MNEARSPALDKTAAKRKGADKQLSMGATDGATMEAKKRHPSRDILRARRACPGCGITMSYHALSCKHRCRGGPEAKRRRRLEQLDVRIERCLGTGGKLEQQQAGEHVQGEEEEPVEEEAPEGVAGEEEQA